MGFELPIHLRDYGLFKEKSEDPKSYTKEDMIDFAQFYFREEYNSSIENVKTSEEIFQMWKETKT
jgi:hypothetical protein